MAKSDAFYEESALIEHAINLNSSLIVSDYRYSALSNPDSLRIFSLLPSANPVGSICGELVEERLFGGALHQDYVALSYVWGERRETHELRIGDRRLSIGRNLNSALYNLRRRDHAVRLWVDAICINQDDVSERNHQVQQMRDIFSSALETVIYLGDQTGGLTGYTAWNFLERHAAWAMDKDRNIDPDQPAKMEELTQLRGELSDVEIDVLQRPWFRRLWVFQEVVVSKTLSIQCGSRRIAWDDLCKILLLSPRYHDRYGFSLGRVDKIEIVRDMFQARCAYQELYGMGHILPPWRDEVQTYKHNTLVILNMLQRARRMEASDPRDKIYGLLGVSAGIDVDDRRFAIDYGQSCRRLYINFARRIMAVTKSYDILSYLDRGSVNVQELGLDERLLDDVLALPSWIPNWNRSQWSSWPLHSISRTILSTLEPESCQEKAQRERSLGKYRSWINSGETLVACGSIIGEILYLSPVITLSGHEEQKFQELHGFAQEAERQIQIMRLWQTVLKMPAMPSNPTAEKLQKDSGKSRYLGIRTTNQFHVSFDYLTDSYFTSSSDKTEKLLEIGSVEHHLLTRARKTASWTDDASMAATLIVDKTSVVDGKRIAVYRLFGEQDNVELAIVPAGTLIGDSLIDLRGGRVPFAVRLASRMDSSYESSMLDDFGIRQCRLVGEAVVNRGSARDSTWRERVFVIR